MSKAAFSIRAPLWLFVPAKLAFCGPIREIEMAYTSKFWFVVTRQRTLSGVISMINVNFLYISPISYCYVDGSTWIQCIFIHSIHSFISMHLTGQKNRSYTLCKLSFMRMLIIKEHHQKTSYNKRKLQHTISSMIIAHFRKKWNSLSDFNGCCIPELPCS